MSRICEVKSGLCGKNYNLTRSKREFSSTKPKIDLDLSQSDPFGALNIDFTKFRFSNYKMILCYAAHRPITVKQTEDYWFRYVKTQTEDTGVECEIECESTSVNYGR